MQPRVFSLEKLKYLGVVCFGYQSWFPCSSKSPPVVVITGLIGLMYVYQSRYRHKTLKFSILSSHWFLMSDAVSLKLMSDAVSLNLMSDAVSLNLMSDAVSLNLSDVVSLNLMSDVVSLNRMSDAVSLNRMSDAVSLNRMSDAVSLKRMSDALSLNPIYVNPV